MKIMTKNLINQTEWEKLYELGVIDSEEYKLDSRFRCNKILNKVVSEDKFLKRMLFDNIVYPLAIMPTKDNFHSKTIRDFEFGKTSKNQSFNDLDHYQIIQFNQDWSNIEGIECFKGIFNFPYNHDINLLFDDFEEHGELWETYIINPRFLQYNSSCIGVFYMLNVDHIEDLISSLNGYFIKLTGYPLFFKPTLDDIDEIKPIILELSRKNFIKPFMKENPSTETIMFYKLLKFWAENECVTVEEFKTPYERYCDNIEHSLWIGFNLKVIKSKIPFEFVHCETGDVLGPFTHFEYDPAFDCYYSNGKTYPINFVVKESFKRGLYDIRLCE